MRIGRRAFLVIATLFAPLTRLTAAAQSTGSPTMSRDEFVAISSRLTGHRDLDPRAADVLLKALAAVPGHIEKLRRSDPALERELIVAWYTGEYEFGGPRRLATHAGALHWRAIGIPTPGMCAGRFGAWAQLPTRS